MLRCGRSLVGGTPAVWDRASRSMRCIECPTSNPTSPEIDYGVAGRLARAEFPLSRQFREQHLVRPGHGSRVVDVTPLPVARP